MDWRDDLADELGYTICPLRVPTYVFCDNDCNNCDTYIDFIKGLNKDRKEEVNKK